MPIKKELMTDELRPLKRFLFLHAEENAISYIKHGEGHTAYLNINPCGNCAKLLAVHNIKEVVFIETYPNCNSIYKHVFDFYGVKYRKLYDNELSNIKNYLQNQINSL
jgi:deoxycytidylate deaminase